MVSAALSEVTKVVSFANSAVVRHGRYFECIAIQIPDHAIPDMREQKPVFADRRQQQRACQIVYIAAMFFGFFGQLMPQDGEHLLPNSLGILTFLILSKPVRGQFGGRLGPPVPRRNATAEPNRRRPTAQ